MKSMNGFFLIDKKEGWTSRDVVTKISHIFHERKVGHSGTLDPFATGLLVISIGRATKANICLDGLDKEYIATLQLGGRTISGDKTNEIIEEKPIKTPTKEEILKVFDKLKGPQKQVPPMVSSVRYKGQKLYHLALQGIEVDRPARGINIYELELLDYTKDTITFRAKVSKGTYIRVLGETIANELGNIGYLTALRRTKVGDFSIEDAIDVLEVSENKLISNYDALSFMPMVELDDEWAIKASHGVALPSSMSESRDIILAVDKNHMVIAIYKYDGDHFKCLRGINDYGDNSI